MRITNQKKAFTLPEVIVAMGIIVMVIFAATNLVVSIIRSNNDNVNTIVAYGLAQEGLEAMRNIRDSDWLLGIGFNGSYKGENNIWGDAFSLDAVEVQYFTVQLNSLFNGDLKSPNISEMVDYVPWSIKMIATSANQTDELRRVLDGTSDQTLLYKQKESRSNEIHFVHGSSFQSSAFVLSKKEPSIFHRYVTVIPESYGVNRPVAGPAAVGKVLKLRVSSVVTWQEYGRKREVRLDTELTDWKDNY